MLADKTPTELICEAFDRECCPRCRCCEVVTDECEMCSGEGYVDHDCGEDTCCCLDPDNNVPCGYCHGTGTWKHCGGFCDESGVHQKRESA